MVTIRCENVTLSFREKRLFESLDLEIEQKADECRLVGLMGPSGSGKTSFLKLVAGILCAEEGRFLVNPRGSYISYLPQESVIFDHLSLDENLKFLALTREGGDRFDKNAFAEVCRILDIDRIEERDALNTLSGGEKQRICLARALAVRPEILLLDEPCTGLDPKIRDDLLKSLRLVCETLGNLCIYASHQADEIRLIADDVIYIDPSVNLPTRGPSAVYFEGADRIFSYPRKLSIARAVSSEPICTLEAEVRRHKLHLVGCTVPITGSVRDGKYLVALSPRNIKVENDGFLPIRLEGSSKNYWLVRLGDERDLYYALRSGGDSAGPAASLVGSLQLFTPEGTAAGNVDLA